VGVFGFQLVSCRFERWICQFIIVIFRACQFNPLRIALTFFNCASSTLQSLPAGRVQDSISCWISAAQQFQGFSQFQRSLRALNKGGLADFSALVISRFVASFNCRLCWRKRLLAWVFHLWSEDSCSGYCQLG